MSETDILEIPNINDIDNLNFPSKRKDYQPSIFGPDENGTGPLKSETLSRISSPKKKTDTFSATDSLQLKAELDNLSKKLNAPLNLPIPNQLFMHDQHQRHQVKQESLNSSSPSLTRKSYQSYGPVKTFEQKLNNLVTENAQIASALDRAKQENMVLEQNLHVEEEHKLTTVQQLEETKKTLEEVVKELERESGEKEALSYQLQKALVDMDRFKNDHEMIVQEKVKKQTEIIQYKKHSDQLKNGLNEILDKYNQHVKESEKTLKREDILLQKLKSQEAKILNWQKDQETAKEKFERQQEELNEWTKVVGQLKSRITDLERNEFEHFQTMQLMKDQSKENELLKEKSENEKKHLLQETVLLKEKIETSHKLAREKAEKELEHVKTQFLNEKRKLLEEMNAMEESRMELRFSMEQSMKDKRKAEQELQRITKSWPLEMERYKQLVEELSTKFSQTERDKSELARKLENTKYQVEQQESRHDVALKQSHMLNEDLNKRLKKAESDLETCKIDVIQYLSKMNELKNANSQLRDEEHRLKSSFEQEKHSLKEHFEMEKQQLHSQLSRIEHDYEKAIKSVQKLTVEQHRESNEQKDQNNLLHLKHQSTIDQLSSQIQRLKQQQQENEISLAALKKDKDQLNCELKHAKEDYATINARFLERDLALGKAKTELQQYAMKEVQYMEEKNKLKYQLDKVKSDRNKLLKSSSLSKYTDLSRVTSSNPPEELQPEYLLNELNRVKSRITEHEEMDYLIHENRQDFLSSL